MDHIFTYDIKIARNNQARCIDFLKECWRVCMWQIRIFNLNFTFENQNQVYHFINRVDMLKNQNSPYIFKTKIRKARSTEKLWGATYIYYVL